MEARIAQDPFAFKDENRSKSKVTIRLQVPEVLALFEQPERSQLLRFLAQMREAARLKKRTLLNFKNTQKLYPCGTLLFISELYRLIDYYDFGDYLIINYPDNDVVEQLFQHIGFLGKLGKKNRAVVTSDKVVHWKFLCGTNVDLSGVSTFHNDLITSLGFEGADRLVAGIGEAITNCMHHAYLEDRNDGIPISNRKAWWLFVAKKDDEIHVVICDLGIGIPRSLEVNNPWPAVLFRSTLSSLGMDRYHDSGYIETSLELGKTRTGQDNRGKGLPQIVDVVNQAKKGGLRIFSNRGFYNYNAINGKSSTREFGDSIFGTIIQWSFPISDYIKVVGDE